jgi:hypothetical protein
MKVTCSSDNWLNWPINMRRSYIEIKKRGASIRDYGRRRGNPSEGESESGSHCLAGPEKGESE